jgi:cysteine desulfurase
MLPYLGELFGNPSSGYRAGREARAAVERARAQVAALVGGRPEEIVFTSGGTEANNLALIGFLRARGAARPHVVASAIEHPAVVPPHRARGREGGEVALVAPGSRRARSIRRFSRRSPDGASRLMHANNELGTPAACREVPTRRGGGSW